MTPQRGKLPPASVPLSFVTVALATLGATLIWMVVGRPPTLAVVHALAVGVFLTVALGLLYQFIPVVTGSVLRFSYLAYVHLGVAACGTASIVFGFGFGDFALVALGGALHAIGFALECFVLVTTVYGRRPPAAGATALLSFAWLVATIALGIAIAVRLSRGSDATHLLSFHVLAGLAGFFGTLILGVSLRLLRMFERVDREGGIAPASIAAHAGVLVALVGGIARVVLIVALIPFFGNLARVVRARNPAYQRETLWYAICSALGALSAAVAAALGDVGTAVILGLWFFVGTAEVGYLQRIVPFIWWMQRAKREGARVIPTLGEMNDSRLGTAILVVWLCAGALLAAPVAPNIGAAIGVFAWLALLAQLLRPFVLRKVPRLSGATDRTG